MGEWFNQRLIPLIRREFHDLINGFWEANGIGASVKLMVVDPDRCIVDPVTENEIIEYFFKSEFDLRCGIVPKEDEITYNELGANIHEHHILFFDAYTFDLLGIIDVTHKKFPTWLAEHYISWNEDIYKIVKIHPKGITQSYPVIVFAVLDKNPVTK
jgi:hypothetical protein